MKLWLQMRLWSKLIAEYNNKPEFFEEIGTSMKYHNSAETGCFYTEALLTVTGADIVFQNYGGIRAGLDYGAITPFDIYTIDPFQNGLDSFTMTVASWKLFSMLHTPRHWPIRELIWNTGMEGLNLLRPMAHCLLILPRSRWL